MGHSASKPKSKSSPTLLSNSSSSPSSSSSSRVLNSTFSSVFSSEASVVVSNSSVVKQTLPVSSASTTGSHTLTQKTLTTQAAAVSNVTSSSDASSTSFDVVSSSTSVTSRVPSNSIMPTTSSGNTPGDGDTVSTSASSSSSVSSTVSPTSPANTGSSPASPSRSADSASNSATSSSQESRGSTSADDSSSKANGSASPSSGNQASAQNAAPASTTVASTSDQTSAQKAAPASTSVKVVTQTFPSSTLTSTSTIAQQPVSTLSAAVAVTVTSSGHTQISFPALVTLVSTSSLADGDLTTWTSVVMNPTSGIGAAANDQSFVDNKGALGGTIAAVVVVVLAFIAGLIMCCRRRRKRQTKRLQWIENIQKRLPVLDDPAEDSAPVMRSVSQSSRNEHYYHFESTSPQTSQPFFDLEDTVPRVETRPSNDIPSNSLGLISMERAHTTPFSDSPYSPHDGNNQVGLAVTTTSPLAHQSRPSLTQSSPSIYPPSLPQTDDASVFEEIELTSQRAEQASPFTSVPRPHVYPSEAVGSLPSPITPTEGPFDDIYSVKLPVISTANGPAPTMIYPLAPAAAAPIRPARSILRESSSKIIGHSLVTPPSSVSGHGHASGEEQESDGASSSPIAMSDVSMHEVLYPSSQPEQKQPRPHSASKTKEDIFTRRTLLDVRPRSSRDNVQSGRQ